MRLRWKSCVEGTFCGTDVWNLLWNSCVEPCVEPSGAPPKALPRRHGRAAGVAAIRVRLLTPDTGSEMAPHVQWGEGEGTRMRWSMRRALHSRVRCAGVWLIE